MKKVRTILIGTSEFAVRIYDRICEKFDIIAVITTPDKPVGRKQILTPSPVKRWALKNNIPILELESQKIKELNPDLIIVTAYGQIIPKEILDIPKFGALNIHPSLLPEYRGASPIQTAILSGDKKTGVTIMLMDEKMDHGSIISNFQFSIFNKPTYKELSDKLAGVGAELLIKTLPDWINGKIKAKPQDHSKATFTKIIKKEDGKIDWNKPAEEIERQIRAFHEWPTAYTGIMNKESRIMNLKILEAEVVNKNTDNKVGQVFLDENKNLAVQTGNGVLILRQIQLEGKRVMSARDFLNGHPEIVGSNLQ